MIIFKMNKALNLNSHLDRHQSEISLNRFYWSMETFHKIVSTGVENKNKAMNLIQNKNSIHAGFELLSETSSFLNEQDSKILFPILQEYLFSEQEELRNFCLSCFSNIRNPESLQDVHTTLINFFEKFKMDLDEENYSKLVDIFSKHLKDENFILESLDFLSMCLEKNLKIQNRVSDVLLKVLNEKNMELLIKKDIISKFIDIFVKRSQKSISMENISLKKIFELILKIETSRNLFDKMKGSRYLVKHSKLKYIHQVFRFDEKKKILSNPISIHQFKNLSK
jgi:hypothetical protein